MRLLIDTHLLLWTIGASHRLPSSARTMFEDPAYTLVFSTANMWEIAFKRGLQRRDFDTDPRLLRHQLLNNGYEELPITSDHAFAIEALPPIHKDPFDRILVAQASSEVMTLVTADPVVARYPGRIQLV